MGCGISQSVLRGHDDISKSHAFIYLCTCEKNPIAVHLNGYFNALISECLYKSQGDINGYERLLAKRPKEITVNRSQRAAQCHGIGHKALTVDGVNDIMNLFLGHVIKSLEKRKWNGTFNYSLIQPMSDVCVEDGNVSTGFSSPNLSSCPQKSTANKSSASVKSGKKAVADPPADLNEAALQNALPSQKSMCNVASSATGNSGTLLFIDYGNGSRRDDSPNRQWRMELSSNITYTSVDGSQALICNCNVALLFFTCDTNLPPPRNGFGLKGDLVSPSSQASLHVPSVSPQLSVPIGGAAKRLGPVAQPAYASVPEREGRECPKRSSPNSDEKLVQHSQQPKPADSIPVATVY